MYVDVTKENNYIKYIFKYIKLADLESPFYIKVFFSLNILHWRVKQSSLPQKSGILLCVCDSLIGVGMTGLTVCWIVLGS
jgi:hypothetical protein